MLTKLPTCISLSLPLPLSRVNKNESFIVEGETNKGLWVNGRSGRVWVPLGHGVYCSNGFVFLLGAAWIEMPTLVQLKAPKKMNQTKASVFSTVADRHYSSLPINFLLRYTWFAWICLVRGIEIRIEIQI